MDKSKENGGQYVKIPTWVAALICAAILGGVVDMQRNVYALKSDIRSLKSALIAKGVIDANVCKRPDNDVIVALTSTNAGFQQHKCLSNISNISKRHETTIIKQHE